MRQLILVCVSVLVYVCMSARACFNFVSGRSYVNLSLPLSHSLSPFMSVVIQFPFM